MNFQITQAALDALAIDPGLRPSIYKLGSGTGYTPSPTDTGLHGGQIAQGNLSPEDIVSGNVIRYSVILPYDVGPFDFGEVGLYTDGGLLFALGVTDTVMHKTTSASPEGPNAIRLDAYLSSIGSVYDMWLDVAETSNAFQMAVLNSVDQLPTGANSVPAAYIVRGKGLGDSFRAYTDGNGLWNFDEYVVGDTEATVVTADLISLTLPLAAYFGYTGITSDGDMLIEFSSGQNFSTVRIVHNAVISGPNITLIYKTPLTQAPIPGDQFLIFKRRSGTQYVLPIASSTVLGGVKIGAGITITADGTISAQGGGSSYTLPPATTSVLGGVIIGNGLAVQGNGLVSVKPATTAQIGGLKVGTTLTVQSDGTVDYTLPKASVSVLGGIKVGNGLSIAGDGTLSAASSTNPYDVPTCWIGAMPANNGLMARVLFARAVNFATNWTGSVASAGSAATAQTIFSVNKNGTQVATVTFNAGQTAGVIAGAQVAFAAGDALTVVPVSAIADSTLADISMTFSGTR